MANTRFQAKRTTTTGLLPNTTNSGNLSYIAAGEFAVNLTDQKVLSSNGTLTFEVGANLSALAIGTAFIANSVQITIGTGVGLSANGGVGSAGQVLTSNGATGSPYWSTSGTAATMNTYTFTVTANTTAFTGLDDNSRTLIYTSGLESVFINGSRQIAGVDYNTTNSTVITLTSNAINGEVVQITTLNASVTSGGGGSGTPGGANTQVQFNDSGAFSGSAGFTFDKNTNNVTIANSLIMNTQSISVTSGSNTLTINPVNMFTGAGNSFSIAANNNNITSIFIAANGNVGIQNNNPGAVLSIGSNTMVLGSSSKTSNGYAWLPNGILMQWGTVASNTTAGDVSFSVSFPTAIIGVTATPATTYIVNGFPNVTTQSTSGCSIRTGSATARTIFWQALGY